MHLSLGCSVYEVCLLLLAVFGNRYCWQLVLTALLPVWPGLRRLGLRGHAVRHAVSIFPFRKARGQWPRPEGGHADVDGSDEITLTYTHACTCKRTGFAPSLVSPVQLLAWFLHAPACTN